MEGPSQDTMENGAAISTNKSTQKGRKQEIDWGKYGLAEKSTYEPRKSDRTHDLSQKGSSAAVTELFDEEGEVSKIQDSSPTR